MVGTVATSNPPSVRKPRDRSNYFAAASVDSAGSFASNDPAALRVCDFFEFMTSLSS